MNRVRRISWKTGATAPLLLSALFSISPLSSADLTKTQILTKELSHEDFKTRERALSELWQIGEASLPALRETAASKDPEASQRAEELILYITIGLDHGSPPDIIELALQYAESPANDQFAILNKLHTQGYWKQALKLIKRQPSRDRSAHTVDLANALVEHHAGQAVLSGDLAEAEEILLMAPDSKDAYMLQAWFYKHLNDKAFAKQLVKHASTEGTTGALRRMALHCINENIPAALAEAQSAKNSGMIQMLKVLSGNAQPWLNEQLDSQVISDGIKNAWTLQLLRLNGEHKKARSLADTILRKAHDNLNGINDSQDSALFTASLAANGYQDHALEILEATHPDSASYYHSSMDNPIASLASLGIPVNALAPYPKWVSNVTKQALEDSSLYERLLTLASFFYYHGQPQHIISVMTPIMTQLELDGSDDWYQLLADMSSSSMNEQALTFLIKKEHQNEALDRGLACLIFKNDEETLTKGQQALWDFIKQRHPGNITESLHEIALLSGIIPDPKNQTIKLHREIISTSGELPLDQKTVISDALYDFSKTRNDLILTHQITKARAKEDPTWAKIALFFDTIFQNWAEAEAGLEQRATEFPSNYNHRIDWYICLRELGKNTKADEVYRETLLFTMMNSQALNDIASRLHDAGYDAEAIYLWQIVLLDKPTLVAESVAPIYNLVTRGQHFYHTGQWKKAAAIKEIYLQTAMRGQVSHDAFSHYLNTRFYTDFCHAMDLYHQGKHKESIARLNDCRKIASNGSLADEFFPTLRKIDLQGHYEQWFEESYQQVAAACKLYPNAHNTQNTAAWLSARAVMRLNDGLKHAKVATALRPSQGAYLDTMAEIWFAKGSRSKALKWSKKATTSVVSHAQGSPKNTASVINEYKMLQRQQKHFRNDPLPTLYKAKKR